MFPFTAAKTEKTYVCRTDVDEEAEAPPHGGVLRSREQEGDRVLCHDMDET